MGKALSGELSYTWTGLVLSAVMCVKDADGMANSEDPDQTAP